MQLFYNVLIGDSGLESAESFAMNHRIRFTAQLTEAKVTSDVWAQGCIVLKSNKVHSRFNIYLKNIFIQN